MGKSKKYSSNLVVSRLSYQAFCILKLSQVIRLGGLSFILLIALTSLNACGNRIFINSIHGGEVDTQAAPPDNDDPNGNSTGDNNRTGPYDDYDLDGIINSIDVDEDGDGLIELDNSNGLDVIRYELNGFSRAGVTTGCGGNLTSSASSCMGYELVTDINMSFYLNWQPIGACNDEDNCPNNMAFRGTFEGNNHIISNVHLEPQHIVYGLGLFGSANNANIRNLIIDGFTVAPVTDAYNVGIIGATSNTDISNVKVRNLQINTGTTASIVANVGGLIGKASLTNIANTHLSGSIFVDYFSDRAKNNVGGLIGTCSKTIISGAIVQIDELSARTSALGGLVGACSDSQILGSASQVRLMNTQEYRRDTSGIVTALSIGGLVGKLEGDSYIDGTYSHVNEFNIEYNLVTAAGGLVGETLDYPDIRNSYAVTNYFRKEESSIGGNTFAGIIGLGENAINAIDSYWDDKTQIIINNDYVFNPTGEQTSFSLQSDLFLEVNSIYREWEDLWCDPTTSQVVTSAFQPPNFFKLWDLGKNDEYPALNCLPLNPEEQREASNQLLL